MPISFAKLAPVKLPFHSDGFGWDAFERFCAEWLVSGATLPNLNLDRNPESPSRLRIVDAQRIGSPGSPQYGIDILVKMETGARWVVQCKRVEKLTKGYFEEAVEKAESEFGQYLPERYLLWVTGRVASDATLLAEDENLHPNWTLWGAERLTSEFIQHTPRRRCVDILSRCFHPDWAKAFFPLPEDLLVSAGDFFSRWDQAGRVFHHRSGLVGRERAMENLLAFAKKDGGRKALVLVAGGGTGKSRLLKALAEKLSTKSRGRRVVFLNPEAEPGASLPRGEDLSDLVVVVDDAHRVEIPHRLLGGLMEDLRAGTRLVLAARPGVEESLRGRLMQAGYQASDILIQELKPLSTQNMRDLAKSIVGKENERVADHLAGISGGCALVTVVGAELLKKKPGGFGEVLSSDNFVQEVFSRFEEGELRRASKSLSAAELEQILRCIAMLSPWNGGEARESAWLACHLGLKRSQLADALDSLKLCGLVVEGREGYRVIPDLFSDHLVYTACYDAQGRLKEFAKAFLAEWDGGDEPGGRKTDDAASLRSIHLLKNLSEAQWQAIRRHGATAARLVTQAWEIFLRDFARGSSWERSSFLEKWEDFAVYLPEETLELARRAMEIERGNRENASLESPTNRIVIDRIPGILKPVAIWCDAQRAEALDLLWRWNVEFPKTGPNNSTPFKHFGEIASFGGNFPAAPEGFLDWLEAKLAGPEGNVIADEPCGLLDTALRPFFARSIESNRWQDRKTFVIQGRALSVTATRSVRQRALHLIRDRIISRGTVATMKVIPVLREAVSGPRSEMFVLPEDQAIKWEPEREAALQVLRHAAETHSNHWVNQAIRRNVSWLIVYGDDEKWRCLAGELVNELPDTFESRLARLTISADFDDNLEPYRESESRRHRERVKESWSSLKSDLARMFIERFADPQDARSFLESWMEDGENHGPTPDLRELLMEIGREDCGLAKAILEQVIERPPSRFAFDLSCLLHEESGISEDELEQLAHRVLTSSDEILAAGWISKFFFAEWMQTPRTIRYMLDFAKGAGGKPLFALIRGLVREWKHPWMHEMAATLARRELMPEDLAEFARILARTEKYHHCEVDVGTVRDLMHQLSKLPTLDASPDNTSCLHWFAKKHPFELFTMLRQRVEYFESLDEQKKAGFHAMSWFANLSLGGLEEMNGFENLARDAMEQMFRRSSGDRLPWRELVVAAIGRSPLLEKLVSERLETVGCPEDLADLVSLLSYEHSLVVFRYPSLIARFLRKAREFGSATFQETVDGLVDAARPQMRGYTNGELDGEYRYAMIEAQKALAAHGDERDLAMFYRRILELESGDIEFHRRLAAREDEDSNWQW